MNFNVNFIHWISIHTSGCVHAESITFWNCYVSTEHPPDFELLECKFYSEGRSKIAPRWTCVITLWTCCYKAILLLDLSTLKPRLRTALRRQSRSLDQHRVRETSRPLAIRISLATRKSAVPKSAYYSRRKRRYKSGRDILEIVVYCIIHSTNVNVQSSVIPIMCQFE